MGIIGDKSNISPIKYIKFTNILNQNREGKTVYCMSMVIIYSMLY